MKQANTSAQGNGLLYGYAALPGWETENLILAPYPGVAFFTWQVIFALSDLKEGHARDVPKSLRSGYLVFSTLDFRTGRCRVALRATERMLTKEALDFRLTSMAYDRLC